MVRCSCCSNAANQVALCCFVHLSFVVVFLEGELFSPMFEGAYSDVSMLFLRHFLSFFCLVGGRFETCLCFLFVGGCLVLCLKLLT